MASLPPPAEGSERHELKAEEELRLEASFSKSSTIALTVVKGSAELWGVELALNHPYTLVHGGLKLAVFTWHGCVVDIDSGVGGGQSSVDMVYTSDETSSNVSAVNTHAQLEAIRDEGTGPRVLIVGPAESGKTSLAKVLTAYAVKLGRTPILVDLDPADNCMSVAGSLSACCMDQQSVSMECYASTGLPVHGDSQPLVLWHGGTDLSADLFRAQVDTFAARIDERMKHDEGVKGAGIIVNTNGSIQDEGFQLLLHSVKTLRITVVLVLGHDRLYSMMKSAVASDADSTTKVIKVPRSGGVVSRDTSYMTNCRSRSIKRYFNGSMVEAPAGASASSTATVPQRVWQLTPCAVHVPFKDLRLFKYVSINLSASLLPVAAAQSTEAVQLQEVEITERLQHCVLAVCHPQAVKAHEASGNAKDLYGSGVAGFLVVEKVLMDTDMVRFLSPCAGTLPSYTLLTGNITWME